MGQDKTGATQGRNCGNNGIRGVKRAGKWSSCGWSSGNRRGAAEHRKTEKRRVQEKGRQKGHGNDRKVFVGEREAQGRAQEGGEYPEQNQGRGKISQSMDPCGMGAGGEDRGEDRGEASAKGWGTLKGRQGGIKLRPRGEKNQLREASFLGEGLGELQASGLGADREERKQDEPSVPQSWGRKARRDPQGLGGWGKGQGGIHEASLDFGVRADGHPEALPLEGTRKEINS